MRTERLKVLSEPRMAGATMLLALSGWMDGGRVSTGTVRQLLGKGDAKKVAFIDPDPFYLFNFPGSMEVTALFRPGVRYEGGVVKELELPENVFHCDESAGLVFFEGKEPNLAWQEFADCVFALAGRVGVSRIIFIGSFGGAVPHTREPRLFGSISDESLRPLLKQYGVRPTEYEGPGGFSTFLLVQAPRHGIEMLSLVAEIPGYLEGTNPTSIEAVTRRLGKILNRPVDLAKLREASDEWESEVSAAVGKDEKLAETIRKLEEAYDNELISEVD